MHRGVFPGACHQECPFFRCVKCLPDWKARFCLTSLQSVRYNAAVMTQPNPNRRIPMMSNLLVVVIGQVGCLTLLVILASVLGGLWLDKTFGTKPVFTLVLLFAGIPLSVLLMLYASRKSLARWKEKYQSEEKETTV